MCYAGAGRITGLAEEAAETCTYQELATAYLPMVHCHMLTFSSFMFYVCSANVAQRLRARAGLLGPKREPDDNDEVCSHPANETPRSAPSLHAMQISLTPAMNQTQCFSSQHFSKAIIHKGHAKGTLALATSTRGAATLGGKKGQADLRAALCCVLSIRRDAFFF